MVIRKDTPIMISVLALHHNSKYWPNPHKFDPDRFNTEINNPKSFTERPYLPFGEGSRNFISRLAKMQTKVGLVLMLRKFQFELAAKYIDKGLKYSPASVISAPISGVRLKLSHRMKVE